MKELSIEEKTYNGNYKAYTELINRLEDVKDAIKKQNYGIAMNILCKPYPEFQITASPELKESEDERIRKKICKILWDNVPYEEAQEYIAWLEKQGNPTEDELEALRMAAYEPTKNWSEKLQSLYEKLTHCEQKPVFEMKSAEESLGIDSDTYNEIVDECIYGEQKPADVEEVNFFDDFRKTDSEVEPKFKVEKDKWYVCTSQYCNCIEGRNYKASLDGRIIDDYGTEYDMHDDAYRWFRPWTIEDAKPGDVLVNQNGEMPFIFKECKNNHIYCYCGYTNRKDIFFDRFVDSEGEELHWLNLYHEQAYPATKEQRDQLEKAMADAGYTFDFEKKELKKIEQKPAWSEEDETKIKSIIALLKSPALCTMDGNKGIIDESIKYLKSLKYRVQPQQEWSEENKRIYRSIMYSFAHNYPLTIQQQEFVKSFKERYTWKPNEEQMRVLDLAIRCGINRGTTEETTLVSLFNDLKKLI